MLTKRGEYNYNDVMDFDDLIELGWYFVATNKNQASNHSHAPRTDIDTRAYVFVFKGTLVNAYPFQLFLDAYVPCIYYRKGDVGESWVRVQPMS